MIVLGIDPGLANLGWAVVEMVGQSRRLIAGATLRSVSSLSDDVRVRSLLESVATFARLHRVELIGVEAHVWQGATRSANPEAGIAWTGYSAADFGCLEEIDTS